MLKLIIMDVSFYVVFNLLSFLMFPYLIPVLFSFSGMMIYSLFTLHPFLPEVFSLIINVDKINSIG